MHVATVALALGANDVPIVQQRESSAAQIASGCARVSPGSPAVAAIEIFKLIRDPSEQDALALTAINFGAEPRCVSHSLMLARLAQMTPAPSSPAPATPGRSGISAGKVAAAVVIAVAAAGAAGYGFARYRARRSRR